MLKRGLKSGENPALTRNGERITTVRKSDRIASQHIKPVVVLLFVVSGAATSVNGTLFSSPFSRRRAIKLVIGGR